MAEFTAFGIEEAGGRFRSSARWCTRVVPVLLHHGSYNTLECVPGARVVLEYRYR